LVLFPIKMKEIMIQLQGLVFVRNATPREPSTIYD
jgi:hypothetical protein